MNLSPLGKIRDAISSTLLRQRRAGALPHLPAFVQVLRHMLPLLILALLPEGVWAADAAPLPLETNVKAAMIYNFTHFISWERESREPITICVLGEPAMVTAIQEVASRKDRDRRQVLAQSIVENQSVAGCNVIFVPGGQEDGAPQVLRAVRGLPVLTVGDSKRFVEQGGTMGFFLERDRVRFAINMDTVRRSGLSVSSKLLSLAVVIGK